VQVAKAGGDGRKNRRHRRNNGVNAAKALTAATATIDSGGVGGKYSDKASNGDSSNDKCQQQRHGRKTSTMPAMARAAMATGNSGAGDMRGEGIVR
jgi:hypothetical protein